jgi:glycine/D-amino acid oxidase-like deaminating enzyme/nitrite reductase/ring-hydroxylating ferredoxin subunit
MAHSTPSLWSSAHPSRSAAPLAGDARYDVCVVGGGIAGLTTAYLLARAGRKVALLEAKPTVVSGETMFTTAHLSWVIDDRFSHVASVRGDDAAKAAAASHRGAIDLIEETVSREKIDCDFKRLDGYLFPGSDGPKPLDEEEQTLRRLGLDFEKIDSLPFQARGPALRFPHQGRFHPLKYLSEIAGLIRQHGGAVYTDTRVAKVRGGDPCTVETKSGHTVTCKAAVIAVNSPFEAGTTLHNKVAAYQTYVIAAEVPKGSVPDALYWDTEDPYHYIRLQPGEAAESIDHLIVGGEDHKTGQASDTDERWGRLKAWTQERFPEAKAIKYRWSGEVFETPDGLALIGLTPWNGDNVYIITGDSGMGMTHGTLGARLVADLIEGKKNDLASLYSPSRWMPGAAKTLLQENLNMAAQYADWLTGGDVKSEDEIPPGHGAVIRNGLMKLAVYKDDQGRVTRRSAVCPHMGCIVRWNPGEKTWDCPCHGSRFTNIGKVLHGPSTSDLGPAE